MAIISGVFIGIAIAAFCIIFVGMLVSPRRYQ